LLIKSIICHKMYHWCWRRIIFILWRIFTYNCFSYVIFSLNIIIICVIIGCFVICRRCFNYAWSWCCKPGCIWYKFCWILMLFKCIHKWIWVCWRSIKWNWMGVKLWCFNMKCAQRTLIWIWHCIWWMFN